MRIPIVVSFVVLAGLVGSGCGEAGGGAEGVERGAETPTTGGVEDVVLTDRLVEASCGQCQFGLPGDDCDLAVRFDGTALFVDGSDIDSHGDAHADDGFCNAVRTARVSGRVAGDRFVATAFELTADG